MKLFGLGAGAPQSTATGSIGGANGGVNGGVNGAMPAAGDGGARAAKHLQPASLMRDVEKLAVGFPDRVYRTARGLEASAFMAAEMQAIGLQPVRGSYFQEIPGEPARGYGERGGYDRGGVDKAQQVAAAPSPNGRNVVGFLPGTDPRLRDEVVIIAAHHDSQPGTHQGANDNASGCAGVLAIAKMFVENPPKRSVLFITFDGEECGRKGSRHYAASPLFPLSKTALLVNMDMIGQVHLESGKRSEIYQWASGDRFAKSVLKTASEKTLAKGEKAIDGYPEQPYEAQFFTTDAEPLYRLSVPTVNFLSGRDLDNHKPEDRMPRVIPERIAQYARLAHQVAVEGANHPQPVADVLGVEPGGLLPSFPLIAFRKDVSTRGIHEERGRVYVLEMRLPTFRGLANDLVLRLDNATCRKAGISLAALAGPDGALLTEEVLHRVRERHAALTDAYHEIPKGEVELRREKAEELNALGGIENVLSGAIFFEKLSGRPNEYQVKRVPEKLRELAAGADALGFGELVRRVVDPEHLEDFKAGVVPERAVQVAYENVPPLASATSRAVFALLDPKAAAANERGLDPRDLDALRHAAVRAGPGSREAEHLRAAEATLALADVTDYRGLKKGKTLADVAHAIADVKAAIAPLPGHEAVTKELDFWASWLESFRAVEPTALANVRDRQAGVMVGWNAMLGLWRELAAKLPPTLNLTAAQLEFPATARRELYHRTLDAKKTAAGRDPTAEMYERRTTPLALFEDALRRLYQDHSPESVRELPRLIDELEAQFPGRVAPLRDCLRRLEALEARQNVQLGYGPNNTPVRVLDVRAAWER